MVFTKKPEAKKKPEIKEAKQPVVTPIVEKKEEIPSQPENRDP